LGPELIRPFFLKVNGSLAYRTSHWRTRALLSRCFTRIFENNAWPTKEKLQY